MSSLKDFDGNYLEWVRQSAERSGRFDELMLFVGLVKGCGDSVPQAVKDYLIKRGEELLSQFDVLETALDQLSAELKQIKAETPQIDFSKN